MGEKRNTSGRSTTRQPRPGGKAAAWLCGFLLLGVALVFAQTVRHGFINYDDNEYVYENQRVAGGLTAQGSTGPSPAATPAIGTRSPGSRT